MSGQPYPGAIERNLAVACEPLQRREKDRRRQSRFELPARRLKSDPRQFGIGGVKFLQQRGQRRLEPLPGRSGQRIGHPRRRQPDDAEPIGDGFGLSVLDCAVAGEPGEIDEQRRSLQHLGERRLVICDRAGGKLGEPFGRSAPACRRAQIEKRAAADRALRGRVANDEAVAGCRRDRPLQHELHPPFPAGRERRVAEHHDARADFGRGMMQPHRHPCRDRLHLGREQPQLRIDAFRRRVQGGIDHHLATRNGFLADAVAGEIERAALPGDAALGRPVLRMDRTHARRKARRADGHAIAHRYRAGQHRAGDHGAGARQRERTVDCHPEPAARGCASFIAERLNNRARRSSTPSPVIDGDRNDLRACESGRRRAPA